MNTNTERIAVIIRNVLTECQQVEPKGVESIIQANEIINKAALEVQMGNPLPSQHQKGDMVVLVFAPNIITGCKIECIQFGQNAIHYDVSIKVQRPEWESPIFTRISNVHSSFVYAECEETSLDKHAKS